MELFNEISPTLMIAGVLVLLVVVVSVVAFLYFRRYLVTSKDISDRESILYGNVSKENASKIDALNKRMGGTEKRLKRAGLNIPPLMFTLIRVLVVVMCVLISALIMSNPVVIGVGAVVGIASVEIFLRYRIKSREFLFNEQLAAALPMISENMRSGLTVEHSIRSVVAYMDDPLQTEFGMVCNSLTFNKPLSDALDELAQRLGNRDVERLASIVAVQKEGGGNLAELLDIEAEHIQRRIRMRGHIKSITSTGRMQGIVVGAMPALMLLAMSLMNYETYGTFFFESTLGWQLIIVIVAMELVGATIMRWIYDIKID